jgi:hypothetical protein
VVALVLDGLRWLGQTLQLPESQQQHQAAARQ